MDAVRYFKEKARMVKASSNGSCRIICENCDLSYYKNGRKINCVCFEKLYPEEAVDIVKKWAEEHPLKTCAQVFFEKFPDAVKCDDGTPTFCPVELGWGTNNDCIYNCIDCWSLPAPYKYQECGE